MAKKHTRHISEEELQRQSRKEILRARKESERLKRIRLAVGGVAALLALVFIIAIVNELIVAPNRAVAVVNGEEIAISRWEDRVRYERAQRIISLENQYEAFDGDVGIIQQYSSQTLQQLLDEETLAETILNQMVDEVIIRQEAEKRGITVTDADVDEAIGSFFNYYDGGLPTPLPEPTATIMPTPSLTPIPTAVITEVVPTNTPFPTIEPAPEEARPTATPVSKESFDEQLGELVTQFKELGVDDQTFRDSVRMRLYTERLADALAEEEAMPTEAPHSSVFLLMFNSEADANEALAMIQDSDFLTVWNTIRSAPADGETTGSATEMLWRTQEDFVSLLGEEAGEMAFVLPPNVPSAVVKQVVDAETTRYLLLQVSGREVRPLPERTLQSAKSDLIRALVAEQRADGVEIFELWRSRVPTTPILDPKFLAQPTPAPIVPETGE